MGIGERIETAVDRLVGMISPAAAVRRQHYRRLARDPEYRELYETIVRAGYRAARSGNSTPWTSGYNSTADQELAQDLPTLRNRSRELERDDSIGSGLIRTFTSNVIGTGIIPQAQTGDPKKDSAMEAVYWEQAERLTPDMDLTAAERQQMLFSRAFVDGEFLVRRIKRGNEPVWFQVFEGDRIQSSSEEAPGSRNQIRQGVERNSEGKIVAYWLLRNSTDEITAKLTRRSDEFVRVGKDDAKHCKRVSRPGQSRGAPFCHAILQDIRDLDLLMVASLKRVQIACLLAVFIKSVRSADYAIGTTTPTANGGKRLEQDLVPGMMFKLNNDEEIQTLVPNFPVPEFVPFVIMLCRRIGTALGIPWQLVLKDFSDSTYSSARTDLLEARRTFVDLQKWFGETYLTWEWTEVLKDAALRGDPRMAGVSADDIASVNWVANGWQWVDPLKEAEAVKLELEIGISTMRDVANARGKDWQELLRQRLIEEKAEQDLREEMGLPPKAQADGTPAAMPSEDGADTEDEKPARETQTGPRLARRAAA